MPVGDESQTIVWLRLIIAAGEDCRERELGGCSGDFREGLPFAVAVAHIIVAISGNFDVYAVVSDCLAVTSHLIADVKLGIIVFYREGVVEYDGVPPSLWGKLLIIEIPIVGQSPFYEGHAVFHIFGRVNEKADGNDLVATELVAVEFHRCREVGVRFRTPEEFSAEFSVAGAIAEVYICLSGSCI